MSAPTKNSQNFVTNLLPNHKIARNLFLRNGTFYVRKMISGKRFTKSLHTNDPYLAIHMLKMWQSFELFKQTHTESENFRLNEVYFGETLNLLKKLNVSEYVVEGKTCITPIEKGKKMLISCKYSKHVRPNILTTNKHELTKYDHMMHKMIKYLGNCQDTDILADPHMLEGMIAKLANEKTKSGTFFSQKTLHEYAKLFKRLFDRQSDKELVAGIMNVAIRTHCKAVTKERQPLGEQDFIVLFQAMNKLACGDVSFVDEHIQGVSIDLQHTTDSKKRNRLYARMHNLRLIKEHPEVIYYVILLMMFTGSRVNAISTLKTSNVNVKEKTIEINKDDELVEKGDVRESIKHLKTEGSMRVLPIAKFLIKMKFLNFVKACKSKNAVSQDQFIFENVIKTEEGYRPNYINEAINEFLLILGLKPTKSTEMLDCHSFKTTFVTWNKKKFVDKDLFRSITGNVGNSKDILDNNYTRYSWELTPTLMIEGINMIGYPNLDILTPPQRWKKGKQAVKCVIKKHQGIMTVLSLPLLFYIHDLLVL